MRVDTYMNTNRFYLSDGGMETFMIFNEGFELPHFSAAELLKTAEGRAALRRYFQRYLRLAAETRRGFLLDTTTWRTGAAWSEAFGVTRAEHLDVNYEATAFARAIRERFESRDLPILLNGVVGPAGDAYVVETAFSAADALEIHLPQISALADAGVDLITAMTLTQAAEAAGIALAAREAQIPAAVSFTVETDGRLPTGQPLGDAIREVDAATDASLLYYMINCAHPDHFRGAVAGRADWVGRIGGVRANASRMSHAELDAAETLDDGDPTELGHLHGQLLRLLPNLRVVGGCCGTDHRHVGCIAGCEPLQAVA